MQSGVIPQREKKRSAAAATFWTYCKTPWALFSPAPHRPRRWRTSSFSPTTARRRRSQRRPRSQRNEATVRSFRRPDAVLESRGRCVRRLPAEEHFTQGHALRPASHKVQRARCVRSLVLCFILKAITWQTYWPVTLIRLISFLQSADCVCLGGGWEWPHGGAPVWRLHSCPLRTVFPGWEPSDFIRI